MDLITELISSFDPRQPHFRPTELYKEGWLLKLVLHFATELPFDGYPLSFMPGATWFSEALLPTAFKARTRADQLAESRTNADGVIGHFRIGHLGKADLELNPNAGQFTVVEAKIGSRLSGGTTHASYFDQAARNVACIAEVLRRAGRRPAAVAQLSFVVLAPRASIPKIKPQLEVGAIRAKVERRVSQYGGVLDEWHRDWFQPTLEHTRLIALSWEEVIDWLGGYLPARKRDLIEFYARCLEFN